MYLYYTATVLFLARPLGERSGGTVAARRLLEDRVIIQQSPCDLHKFPTEIVQSPLGVQKLYDYFS